MTNSIELLGLTKHYPGFSLGPLDLTLPGGTILGLIGENGAGKTTLIKAMLGIVRPDGGRCQLLGEAPDAAREKVGTVLDDCFFYGGLQVKSVDNVLRGVYRDWDSTLFFRYLDRFSVAREKQIKALSRGMRMKLSLSAALAHHPRLLLLDEATAGLDPVVRGDVLDVLTEFVSDEAHSVLLSSHITTDLEKCADYIAYLHQGKLLLMEEKDRLLEEYGQLTCSAAELETLDHSLLAGIRRGRFSCQALVRDRAAFRRAYPALQVERISLDAMMVYLNREESL